MFENKYKVAASTEIERHLFELKSKRGEDFTLSLSEVLTLISYNERLKLISKVNADIYRKKVEDIQREFEKLLRNETGEFVDDIENPREITKRYQSIDRCREEIKEQKDKIKTNEKNIIQENGYERSR